MRHVLFLRGILGEPGLVQSTIPRWCDNRGVIQAATTTGFNGRTKHVDVKLKCSREYVRRGLFEVKYVSTQDQLADIFTKRLRGPPVAKFS